MNKLKLLFPFLFIVAIITGCSSEDSSRLNFEEQGREVPEFNADSAYAFVEKQVNFGPREPNSEGHRQAQAYFMDKLREYAGQQSVFSQQFTAEGYEGDTLELANIIAAFNTQSADRIMICAHWDTRPRADKDSVRTNEPILGADDGASGVGVMLELARIMSEKLPNIGVDLVLFDGEDYGKEGSLEKYFLGSKYWANNPPVPGYSPRFGILLDMVGGEGAKFPKEQYSMQYAPALVNELWTIADEKGYGNYFVDEEGVAISDDHVVINRIAKIPTIDIIRHDPQSQDLKFAPYWHTHGDDMSIISKETLQAVGDVLVELIYNRI